MASLTTTDGGQGESSDTPKLRKLEPYWYEHRTSAKQRWHGRELIEVLVTEFRDRTREYYTWAIHAGNCTINGQKVAPKYVVRNNDEMINRVHKHEPHITTTPIRVLYRDDASGRLVIVKPGSIPVHAAGRYFKHTLAEMLQDGLNIPLVYTSNRLDRLTSGIMVMSTNRAAAQKLSSSFEMGHVRKAYVARVSGEFPSEQVVCREKMMPVDRQTTVSVVHPLGKECETIFQRLSYDGETNTSVVMCRPITGRTHQIRVHLQWLGFPIPNDPIYAHPIWEDLPPRSFASKSISASRYTAAGPDGFLEHGCEEVERVVAALKKDKDDKEDWARWKDEVRFGKLVQEMGWEMPDVKGPNGESAASQFANGGVRKADAADDEANDLTCDTCMVPVHPDPSPEELYIYLHAIKYETDEWVFEDELPWWAREDWQRRGAPKPYISPDGSMPGVIVESAVQVSTDETGKLRVAMGDASLPRLEQRRPGFAEATASTVQAEAAALDDTPRVPLVRVAELPHTLPELPLPSKFPALVLEVFHGVEDFAQHDIERQLALYGIPLGSTRTTINCAHVVVQAGAASSVALRALHAGRLNCVRAAFLLAHEERIPQSILDGLADERLRHGMAKKATTQARQQYKKEVEKLKVKAKKTNTPIEELLAGLALPKDFSALEAQEPVLDAQGCTPSEVEFLALLSQLWERSAAEREHALAAWQATRGALNLEQSTRSFRCTIDRRSVHLPTLSTMTLAKELGELCSDWLKAETQPTDPTTWRVDLVSPLLDVTFKLIPGLGADGVAPAYSRGTDANPSCSALLMFALPGTPAGAASHRPALPHELVAHGTTLARFRAYTLATALPLPQGLARPLRVLEPCAGKGALVVELCAALQRRGIKAQVLGTDIDEADISRAKECLKLCGFDDEADESSLVQARTAKVDGTDLAALQSFLKAHAVAADVDEDGLLDGIVTDLPWGHRVLHASSLSVLYPALFRNFAALLRPGGYVLVMTPDHKAVRNALKSLEGAARKEASPWYLCVENLSLVGEDEKDKAQQDVDDPELAPAIRRAGLAAARSFGGKRTVECGLPVYHILIRKIPMP